jgi:hypothetical protein
MQYRYIESPIGKLLLAGDENELAIIGFKEDKGVSLFLSLLGNAVKSVLTMLSYNLMNTLRAFEKYLT